MHNKKLIAIAVAAALSVSGCGTPIGKKIKADFLKDSPFDPAKQTCSSSSAKAWGTLIGMTLGAVIGKEVGNGAGSIVIGAVIGGAAGNYIGSEIERRQCEIEKIAESNNAKVAFTTFGKDNPADLVALDSEGQFPAGRAHPTPSARKMFKSIAEHYTGRRVAAVALDAARENGKNLSEAEKEKFASSLSDLTARP